MEEEGGSSSDVILWLQFPNKDSERSKSRRMNGTSFSSSIKDKGAIYSFFSPYGFVQQRPAEEMVAGQNGLRNWIDYNGGHPPPIHTAVEEHGQQREQEKKWTVLSTYISSLYSPAPIFFFYIYVKRIYPARDPTCMTQHSTAVERSAKGGREDL